MKTKIWMLLALCLFTVSVMAEEGPADARRHMIRGVAAIEMAKSNAELTLAADEFIRATELDPSLSAAWYNLGSVQSKLGQFDEAIESYKRYLTLVPNAEDAQKVQDEMVKLEFRQEIVGKSKARSGTWVALDGTPYLLTVDGNSMTLVTDMDPVTDDEAEATMPIVGKMWISDKEQITYRLNTSGRQLTGTWMHTAIKAGECTFPEESGNVTGDVLDSEGIIVLRYERTKFQAATQGSLFGEDSCQGVNKVGKRAVEVTFRGPLPHGGGWIVLRDLASYWPGGFSAVQLGWRGHLLVSDVRKEFAGFMAGLRAGDEIMAIDGVEVKSLSAQDAVWRLHGEIGTEVSLTVIHKDQKVPVTLQLKRVETPTYSPNPKHIWIN